ncbi:MAG: hypothetical protein RIQ79_241 [Verrucomicrobiota bacterium]
MPSMFTLSYTSAPSITPTVHAGQSKPRAVFALDPAALDIVYSREDRAILAGSTQLGDLILTPDNWRSHLDTLREVEFIFSGWKSPVYDASFLAAAPRLRAIFYAAGSVRYCTTEAFWERDIPITSSYAANAVPVAEYTVAVSILAMKQFWRRADLARHGKGWGDHTRPIPGAFRATIGLVSYGMIARRVAEMLAAYDVRILVYCPYLSEAESSAQGVERASLEQVFRESDVVSVHTPVLPDTIGLINGRLVSLMKPEATLINTARGKVLHQPSLIETMKKRPDLTAILDVTDPEPPTADDPLFTLPNIIVTPHIAGSHGSECQRLGSYMVEEYKRFLSGETLRWRITREMSLRMA